MEMMVFGAGYVGLVTGAGFASTGNHVTVVDTHKNKIETLKSGGVPFYEPQLPELIARGRRKAFLDFALADSKEYEQALEMAEIYFIAVGTPELPSGKADLQYVRSVVQAISQQKGTLSQKMVVVKSTVPVGTGDLVESLFREKKKSPRVISNPEFLKQGNAVQDFLKPERVIIGTEDQASRETLSFLYKPFMMKRDRIVCMNRRSAELVKYACNAFLATKISFINEISQLCERVGADVRSVRDGMISDSRIGDQFLFPGLGYGGSCFPKDVESLIAQGDDVSLKMQIPQATRDVNARQKLWAFERLKALLQVKQLSKLKVCLWGLSFKPNTDDLREAPSLLLIRKFLEAGAEIHAYDPIARTRAEHELEKEIAQKKCILFDDAYKAAEGCDALILVTEWQEFRTPNFKRLLGVLRKPYLLDGRNIYDPEILKKYGFKSASIGVST